MGSRCEQIVYENIKYNLTESSVTDMKLGDLNLNLQGLVIAYGDHIGHPKLRELIANEASVHVADVLLTAGAATALFIVSTSLLGKNDRILVERPNIMPRILKYHVQLVLKLIFLKFNSKMIFVYQ